MKTEQEVKMLNLRPYGNYLSGITYERARVHFRDVVMEVKAEDYIGGPHVLSDVFGNLYGFVYEDMLNKGKSSLFLVRLDDGAATIVEEV